MFSFKRLKWLFAILILLVSSCKKEVPEMPPSNSPIFSVQGTFGNESILILAGENDATMSNSVQYMNGVSLFTGKIGANGSDEFEIGILDGNLDIGNQNLNDLITQYNAISMAGYSLTGSTFQFDIDDFHNAVLIDNVIWYVNGSYYSTGEIEITNPGKYDICAQVKFLDGTSSTLCNNLIIGYKNNGDFNINFYQNLQNEVSIWISNITEPIKSITWFSNNIAVGTGEMYQFLLQENKTITAEVTFQNGAKKRRNIKLNGTESGKYIQDFTLKYTSNQNNWDFKSIVNFKSDGINYSSVYTQNPSGKISISDVRYYDLNSEQKPVYLIRGTVQVNVASSFGAPSIPLNLNVQMSFVLQE
jgi:hypothetical protein